MQGFHTTLPQGNVLLNRYVIEGLLGKGGYGAVYLVRDQRVRGNLYALKEVVDPDKKELEHFTFEAQVLERVDHPALPRVYRAFEDESHYRAYMLMDYIEGPNLEQLRHEQPEKRFPLSQVMYIMAPIVDAVNYLHKRHPPVVHRDVKPANIIVPKDGDEAILVDFGIAKEYDEEATTTAIRRCSPGYGAPEQYGQGTNPRTDIYGLAATFYALLTGLVPQDALYRMAQLSSKKMDPLEPVTHFAPDVPEHVSEAIQRAMAINSKDRFASVEEFWQALNAQPIEAVPPTFLPDKQPVSEAASLISTSAPTVLISKRSGGEGTGKRRVIGLLLTFLALLALIMGIIFGSMQLSKGGIAIGNFAPTATHATSGQTPATATVPSTATPATATPTTGITATATVHSTATPATATPGSGATGTATSGSTTYPHVASTYNGSITDQQVTPNVTTTMNLSNIQQNNGTISGSFSVGTGLIGNGNFKGSVTPDNNVQFQVDGVSGNLPLFFQGKINADHSMSGTYCSYQNGQCNKGAGGYGTWNVQQATSQGNFAILRDVA